MYRSLEGGLQYLTFTCLDLSYVVQEICLFMYDLQEPHLHSLKHILRYVHGTLDYGLQIHPSSSTGIIGYSNVDWGNYPQLGNLLEVIACSYVTISYLGLQIVNKKAPARVQRQNIEVLPIPYPKLVGYATFFKNFTHILPKQPLSTMITSVLYTYRAISFNINAPSI